MQSMTKVKVELELVVNLDESTDPKDWNWKDLLNMYDEYGESVEVKKLEELETWQKGYDPGNLDDFALGDKVVLVEAWPDDEDGEGAPYHYDEDDLGHFIENGTVGTVIDFDSSDSTVHVEFKWTDEDGDDQEDYFWILPRALKHVDEKKEAARSKPQRKGELKEGDSVKAVGDAKDLQKRYEVEQEGETSLLGWDRTMARFIGKVGKVTEVMQAGTVTHVRVKYPTGNTWVWDRKDLVKAEAEARDPSELQAGDKVTVTATIKQLMDEGIEFSDAAALRLGVKEVERVSPHHVTIGGWAVNKNYVTKVTEAEAVEAED